MAGEIAQWVKLYFLLEVEHENEHSEPQNQMNARKDGESICSL